jgi:hypothetical protein
VSLRPRKPLRHPRRLGLLLFLLQTLGTSRAPAEPEPAGDTVILLQPTDASIATRRSLARIRDELSADRFRVVWEGSDPTDDPRPVIESTGGESAPEAIVVLFGDPATGQAELRIIHRAAGRSAVRRATVIVDDPEQMPQALASRALELLRATALELSLPSKRAPRAQEEPERSAAVPAAQRPSSGAPASEVSVASVEMGLGMWKSIEGPPPAVIPVGRLGLRLSARSQLRLSVAGLGSRPVVRNVHGTATVSQTMALVEFGLALGIHQRVQPLLSLGGGVLHVAVAGTGDTPYEGLKSQQWSAAGDAGAGLAVALGSRVALSSEIHALLAVPHPVVRFIDTKAATIGNPTLMLTLTLRVAL